MNSALIFMMILAGLALVICGGLTLTEKPDKGGKCKSSGGPAVSYTIMGIGLCLAIVSGFTYYKQPVPSLQQGNPLDAQL